jgi:formylglycine-generating enzyme required for sulfatase activity
MKKYFFSLTILFLCISLFAQKTKQAPLKRAPIDTSKFVLVEGGNFKMGTDKPIEEHEGPLHQVTLKSFYLGKTEVTFEDFDKFCKENNRDTFPSGTWGRGKQPAFMLTWYDAVAYCNWLSEKEKLSKCYLIKDKIVQYLDTAKGYRLPTEAEWEYAARGGNKSTGTFYAGSNDLPSVAWYIDNSSGRSWPIAQKQANELGLFDISGNLWEWVWDWYDWNYYKVSPTENPTGPASGSYRVMRGGAWFNYSKHCTVFSRQNAGPDFKQNSVGFRIARTFFR